VILILLGVCIGPQPRGAFEGKAPQIFLCPEEFVLNNKNNKISPRKIYFAALNIKTWLRTWVCSYFDSYS